MDDLIAGALNGRARALARLITAIENDPEAAATAVPALYPHTGKAHIIGVTGPPGSGKSSLVTELAKSFRAATFRVGIIAVDPTSPFTGGALLGDRVRMRDLAGDADIFIRSMASRGKLGGLAQATWAVIKALDAARFDKIIIETVGAGQAEVDIARASHTTLVVEAPGMGDDVQAFKAGILEIADILVVNKADKPGADRVVKSLEMMLHLGPAGGTRHHDRLLTVQAAAGTEGDGWPIPVLQTCAISGDGVAALADRIYQHETYLKESGNWMLREQDRCRQEMVQLLQTRFLAKLQTAVPQIERDSLVTAVAKREMDPYTAVNLLQQKMSKGRMVEKNHE